MSQTKSETKRPTQRSEMTKWQWTWKEIKRNKTAYFMLAPFLLLFIRKHALHILYHLRQTVQRPFHQRGALSRQHMHAIFVYHQKAHRLHGYARA